MNRTRSPHILSLAFSIGAAAAVLPATCSAAEMATAVGITEPFRDSTLGTQVQGIVVARKFEEGNLVKKNDVVVELDKALEQLEVARREVVLEPLRVDYEAAKFLYEQPKSSMSKEILDKKEADYKVALAEFELAKEQVRRRIILAPFDGYITKYYLEAGEACQIEQPLLRLVDTRRCYFVANVEARSGHSLQLGQKVDLEVESGPSVVKVQGALTFVSPVVDPASGLLKVKAVFDNPDAKIRPGVAGKMMFEEAANVSARK
jgi:RND family efflux transporter MFP subunit